ncbi:MAG: hypothetical protein ACXWUG_01660 [Polyangiales bacterium]
MTPATPRRLLALVPLALVGCAAGGPQIGPGTAAGDREHTVYTTVDPTHYTKREEFFEHGDFGLGILLGFRAGPTSAKVAAASSSAVGLADELHTDFLASWRNVGFGVEATLGAQSVTVDGAKYSFGGFGGSLFLQYSLAPLLFLTAGVGKTFANVSRHTDDPAALHTDVSTQNASIVYGYGGISWIFSDSMTTQWGIAFQLRYTLTTGDATSDSDNLDLSWKSTALLGQILFAKF